MRVSTVPMASTSSSRRITALALLAAALLMLGATAASAAEQRAFSISGEGVAMYERPDRTTKSWTATIPSDGVAVPSAMRDKAGDLWYKATIDGRTGWMHYVGLRLRMGSKSKIATAAFKKLESTLDAILKGRDKSWSDVGATEGSDKTFTLGEASINTISTPNGYRASQFHSSDGRACKQILGFDPIGMKMDALRGKLGTPTIRETPDGEPKSTMLTYEATEGDKRLEVFLENDKVVMISMY